MWGSGFFSTARQLHIHHRFDVMAAHVAHGAGEKAAGAAGTIQQNFAWLGIDSIHHEGGHTARGVVLPRIASALQIIQQLFVDITEVFALAEVVEVNAVDLVHHLPHQLARFHVVESVLENASHHPAAIGVRAFHRQLLQVGEKLIVDEIQQLLARDPFWISSPGAPLQILRNRGSVALPHHLQLLVLVIDDLEEEHPAQLGEALRIPIHPGVLPHDVLDGFDRRSR